jgi:XisI protein
MAKDIFHDTVRKTLMDKLSLYHQIVAEVVTEIAGHLAHIPDRESLLTTDMNHGQYLVLTDGWEGSVRQYATIVHIEVKSDATIWLRCDATDLEIGETLIQKGIQRTDIIPAFFSPQMREYAASH